MSLRKPGRLPRGTEVGPYMTRRFLGSGTFGAVYSCRDPESGQKIALKVEPRGTRKKSLYKEIEIYEDLGESPYLPKIYGSGDSEFGKYLAMELLGPPLFSLRECMHNEHFSTSTVTVIAIESFKAIREVHQRGYVHRDIKPGNFVVRPNHTQPIVLLDFGLSKRFRDKETNAIIPPRSKPGFVGTSSYASINALDGGEQSPSDDLMSWFYMMLKINRGKLPWAQNLSKQEMKDCKMEVDLTHFCRRLPSQYLEVYDYLKTLAFGDEPDYERVIQILESIDCDRSLPLDWEVREWKKIKRISAIPLTRIKEEIHDEMTLEIQPESPTDEAVLECTLLTGVESPYPSDHIPTYREEEEKVEVGCTGCLFA